jgi:hypothetical protein
MLGLSSLVNWVLYAVSVHVVPSLDSQLTLELDVGAPLGSKNVIVQMFEWTWDSVANECSNFLGPAGYGFVQGRRGSKCLEI